VYFLTYPQERTSTLRPIDVLVYGWIEEKHVCVDLTEVSPLVGLRTREFIVGQATPKGASNKVVNMRIFKISFFCKVTYNLVQME
jgi:hypothetical protein